jgi:hypothetical protein
MKLNAEVCKLAIVKKARTMFEIIKADFDPTLTDEEVRKTVFANNWRQSYRQKNKYSTINPDGFERLFDCIPFDDQLRAYVYSDPTDTHILKVDIIGE